MTRTSSNQALGSSSRTAEFDSASTTSQTTGKAKGKAPQRTLGAGTIGAGSRTASSSGGHPVRSSDSLGKIQKLVATEGRGAVTSSSAEFDARVQATRRTKAVVDMGRVRRNFRTGLALISSATPDKAARGGAVLKANAYGLGAVGFAKVLASEGCRDFFVAELGEALELRRGLMAERPELMDQITINVLNGLDTTVDPKEYVEQGIMPVLNGLDEVRHWNAIAADMKTGNKLKEHERLDCILQFDSGMSRTGMSETEAAELMAEIDAGRLPHIEPQLMMSHLGMAGAASAETADPQTKEREPGAKTLEQLERFNKIADQVKQRFPEIQESLGASSTVFLGKNELGKSLHKSMVRMGATFHAQAPFEADTNPLEPTLTVTSKLTKVTWYPAGEKAGYNGEYIVPEGGRTLATFAAGWHDLLPDGHHWNHQSADGRTPTVRVRTGDGTLHTCGFAGKMSMDMSTIDVSGIPKDQLKAGLEVVLIDDDMTTDQFAAQFGAGASNVQARIASRVGVSHVESEPVPSRDAEPTPDLSPWSKQGREDRLQKAAIRAGAFAAAQAARDRGLGQG